MVRLKTFLPTRGNGEGSGQRHGVSLIAHLHSFGSADSVRQLPFTHIQVTRTPSSPVYMQTHVFTHTRHFVRSHGCSFGAAWGLIELGTRVLCHHPPPLSWNSSQHLFDLSIANSELCRPILGFTRTLNQASALHLQATQFEASKDITRSQLHFAMPGEPTPAL